MKIVDEAKSPGTVARFQRLEWEGFREQRRVLHASCCEQIPQANVNVMQEQTALNPYATSQADSSKTRSAQPISTRQVAVVLAACLLTVCLRLFDTPMANFGTMVALALFCGSVVKHPVAVFMPLAIRATTDFLVHWKTGYGFFESWPFDYSAYALVFFLGSVIPSKKYAAVCFGGLASVGAYFVISNLGVWYMWPDTYPRTAAGLMNCFNLALPFARGTIVGNLIAVPVFFAAWNSATAAVSQPEASLAVADK